MIDLKVRARGIEFDCLGLAAGARMAKRRPDGHGGATPDEEQFVRLAVEGGWTQEDIAAALAFAHAMRDLNHEILHGVPGRPNGGILP